MDTFKGLGVSIIAKVNLDHVHVGVELFRPNCDRVVGPRHGTGNQNPSKKQQNSGLICVVITNS
jgi:hypothetical protein